MEKVAVIEIDSRELKLTLAKIFKNNNYVVYDQISDAVKLGEDLGKDHFFKANRVNETITILKGYKKLCDANQISKIDCVLRNDCKLAKNLKSFVDEVVTNVGVKVKILDEDDELKTMYMGVINTLDAPKGVVIRIGYESTSIISYIRRSVLFEKVIPFGVSTLADKFIDSKNQVADAYDFFKQQIKHIEELKDIDPEFQIVGVGEIFQSIAKVSRLAKKYSYDKNHGYVMFHKDVEDVFKFFKELDLDSKQKIRGISDDRADFVSVGSSMVQALIEKIDVDNLIIGEFELTDGILLNYSEPQTLDKPITDILGHSLATSKCNNVDSMENSENVSNIAMILYKQLKVLHKLPRTYVKVLRIASYFYNSGTKINFYGNSKNSFAAVLNANLSGVGHKEQVLAAFVCASQYASDFNLVEFVKYRDILSQEDLDALKKLAVIVRIAKGLDRCGSGTIKDITCDILGDSVILKAICEDNVAFEIRDAMKCAEDFKKAYKKNLEIL